MLDEARRTLRQQGDDLKSLRDRAAQLLTVAALAVAFLGGLPQANRARHISAWTWVAVAAFGALTILVLMVWIPRRTTLSTKVSVLERWLTEEPMTTAAYKW